MRYISTRGQAPARDFADVLLTGLAGDGGLFMPETWPHFSAADWRAMRGLSYPALAARIMQPFVGAAIPAGVLSTICHDAYAAFGHPAVAPLVQLETHLFVQELFHGPTLAFKDMAMQVLGRLFDYVLIARDTRVTIVAATSGDTGSAAIEVSAYPKVADEYQQIVIGRVDAVWEIDTSMADFMGKNVGKFEVAYILAQDNTFGVYYGKGKTDLGTALTSALKALKDDGTLAGIATKYNLDPANLSVIK